MGKRHCSTVMLTNYQLSETPDLWRYSTQCTVCKSVIYEGK
ncbi:hypothetical protein T10_12071 [Trichinella papuae]|uniref:Uncharacterized protein n=1 Tax=Trichinella papuae TaxID=268474 RepID=A0A0V1LVK9_9BILA|nr:hypothetical protein T10_12071 [Trichinella papuae]